MSKTTVHNPHTYFRQAANARIDDLHHSSFRSLDIQERRNAARIKLLTWMKKHGGLNKRERHELDALLVAQAQAKFHA